ncbi:hypothetical protein BDQ17DRAFT_1284597 [Cyathus striatus]|nr:hypothetical protein BDQ17DRAFT_1284597 [Cyathus striatus]
MPFRRIRNGGILALLAIFGFYIILNLHEYWNYVEDSKGSVLLRNESTLRHYGELEEAPSPILETTLPGHGATHGFTFLDRLYARNGVFYIVTYNSTSFPPKLQMISQLKQLGGGYDLEKTEEELQFISPEEARTVLGNYFLPAKGVSVIINDPPESLNSYYQWWGEVILGFWRMYAVLGLYNGFTADALPLPERFILPNTDDEWRDYLHLNAPIMLAAFNRGQFTTQIVDRRIWLDNIRIRVTVVYERAILISRASALLHPLSVKYQNMVGSTMMLDVPDRFWEPIRTTTVQSILGRDIPYVDKHGITVNPPFPNSTGPVVTYISRQVAEERMLRQDDHERLVAALLELGSEGIAEVHIEYMEDLTFQMQFEVIARTTVLIGIHGAGLTHQLWMPATPKSTVIEIMHPNNYLYNYLMIALNMGHKHYMIWNDTVLTKEDSPEYGHTNDHFDNRAIPLHIPTVMSLVREQLR